MMNANWNSVWRVWTVIVISAGTAQAWGPLAHIGAHQPTSRHSNLPDIWVSNKWPENAGVGLEVSPFFAWSHACQRAGVHTESVFIVPNTPTAYGQPAGVSKPEEVMWQLIGKLWYTTAVDKYLMKETAKGFASHNAADGVVHFEYFLGGSIGNWIVHHAQKEEWAEFLLFQALGGTWQGLWRTPTAPPSMIFECTGNARIIHLAQKAFRKNRQTVDLVPDSVNAYATISVETVAMIEQRIATKNQELSNYIYEFNESEYEAWLMRGLLNDWDVGELYTLFADSMDAADAAVTLLPQVE